MRRIIMFDYHSFFGFLKKSRCTALFAVGLLTWFTILVGCQSAVRFIPPHKAVRHHQLPKQVIIHYSWIGLTPQSIVDRGTLTWDAAKKQYNVHWVHQTILKYGPSDQAKQVTVTNSTLPMVTVRELLKTIKDAPWRAVSAPVEVIEHTDDYPNIRVTFVGKPSEQTVTLSSTSNSAMSIPWNVQIAQRYYSSDSRDLAQAVYSLLNAVRPEDNPKAAKPNTQAWSTKP